MTDKTEAQQLIDGILAAKAVPKWRKVAIAQAIEVSNQTIAKLASGKQTETRASIMDALRALHATVCSQVAKPSRKG